MMFIFYICKILRGVISIETVIPQPRRVSVKSLFLSSSFSQKQYEEFYRRVPKTKGDLGKNTFEGVTLQEFLVEEQVCLRVEYP